MMKVNDVSTTCLTTWCARRDKAYCMTYCTFTSIIIRDFDDDHYDFF